MRARRLSRVLSSAAGTLLIGAVALCQAESGGLDQESDPPETPPFTGGAWNIGPGNAGQTFTPSRPCLSAVAVDLTTVTPGKGGDSVTLQVLNAGKPIYTGTAKIPEGFDGWWRFNMPRGCIAVTPGRPLTVSLEGSGKAAFGWRYGGNNPYVRGEALALGPDTDFYFRTYGGPSCTSGLTSGRWQRVPFELHHRYLVVVRGTIGRLEGLRFLVDTGSNPTMVDRKIAKKLTLDVQRNHTIAFGQKSRTDSATVEGIRIGPVAAGKMRVSVGDLSFLDGLHAVIGLDLLARSSFRVDYEQRWLEFGPVAQPGPGVPLDATPPFLTAPVSIAGVPYRFLVDTGSRRLVLFRRRVQNRLPPACLHGTVILNDLSAPVRLDRVLLRSVELGAAAVDRLEGFVSDIPVEGYPPEIDGVLGLGTLDAKSVAFDFEGKRLLVDRLHGRGNGEAHLTSSQ